MSDKTCSSFTVVWLRTEIRLILALKTRRCRLDLASASGPFFRCQSILNTAAVPVLSLDLQRSSRSRSGGDAPPLPVITLASVEPQRVSTLCFCRRQCCCRCALHGDSTETAQTSAGSGSPLLWTPSRMSSSATASPAARP